MKLKNKKTGEIIDYNPTLERWNGPSKEIKYYVSLAELNEEWEDYEEPTTYYYISDFGAIREGDVGKYVEDEIARKGIGNYFETEEEAEQAAEKLKALERLKDKGFRFRDWNIASDGKGITIFANYPSETRADLDLLFGGEK